MESRSPKRAVIVTLTVLALSWFAFPAPVAGWLYDHCGELPICPPLQAMADGVDAASRSVGIASTMEAARDQLRALFGIDFY
jgi:hypothetical protein